MKALWIAGLWLVFAGPATAGDIYTCKGAHGEKVYQNAPCPTPDKQVDHQQYDPAMARAADGSAGATDRIYTSLMGSYSEQSTATAGYSGGARYSNGSPPVPGERTSPAPTAPTGYQCKAGQRIWMQTTRCPATYKEAQSVDVDGRTITGQMVRGSGWIDVEKPVQQQAMDRDAFCDQVRAGARIGEGGGTDASQSYERNKLKRNLCDG